jgi:hypothetical protein
MTEFTPYRRTGLATAMPSFGSPRSSPINERQHARKKKKNQTRSQPPALCRQGLLDPLLELAKAKAEGSAASR